MAAILNSAMLDSDTAILDSDTLLSSLRFTQKHSHSTLTLTQTNSIWLKPNHYHSTWWWQPSWILLSWILPSRIQPSLFFLSNSLTLAKIGSHHLHKINLHSFIGSHHLHKKTSLIDSDWTSWWQPYLEFCNLNSIILDSATAIWIQTPYTYLLSFTQKHSHSILTLTETNSIWLKLIDSHLTLIMAAILQSTILDSAILVFPLKLTHTCQDWLPPSAQKFNFTHSFWLNLMMAAILISAMLDSVTAILDSDTLLSSLRFTQKHSHSILTLTQTNSIWLKLIHYHSTWWWQPFWILSSWFSHCHLGFSNLTQTTHTCQDSVLTDLLKKHFTHTSDTDSD